MRRVRPVVVLAALWIASRASARYAKPVYISLPGPGNIQHLAYVVAKQKGFYEETGVANAEIVALRGDASNVQALASGSVDFSSAFGPAMQTMFRGEPLVEAIVSHGKAEREVAAWLYDPMREAVAPRLDPEGVMKGAELEFAVLKEKRASSRSISSTTAS